MRMDGADTELYSNRGASHLMIGNEDAAMSDFDAGLVLKPGDATLHFNRRQCWRASESTGTQ